MIIFKKINRMKKLFAILIFGAACLGARAQYQLGNSAFEKWEAVSYNSDAFIVRNGVLFLMHRGQKNPWA